MLWLGSPPDIDIGTVLEAMRSGDGVVDVHHLHLRQMQEPLLSAIFEQFVGECAIGCFSAGATSHDLAEPSIHLLQIGDAFTDIAPMCFCQRPDLRAARPHLRIHPVLSPLVHGRDSSL